MTPKKMCRLMILLLVTLFVWGICEAHETHLSDVGVLTNTTVTSCRGTFIVVSDELGCSVVYKYRDISGHSCLHIEPWPLNEDGECVCPAEKD